MLTQVLTQSPYPPIPHSTTFRQDVSGRTGSEAGDLKSQSYPSPSPRTAAPSCCFTPVHKWLPPHGLRWLFMPSHHVHIPVSIKRKAQKRANSPQWRTFPKNYTQLFCYVPLTMWAQGKLGYVILLQGVTCLATTHGIMLLGRREGQTLEDNLWQAGLLKLGGIMYMKHSLHCLTHSRYLESNPVYHLLLLTQIWHSVEHMQKIINSNPARKGHRERVGEENIS